MKKEKKELSEKQKEVLERNNFKNKPPAVRRALGAKGAEKTNQIKREKIARENSKEWAWEQYGKDFLEDIAKYGTTKDKVEVIEALFPTDKQVNDINFKNLNPDVIVETIEMRKKAEAYTKKLLND